MWVKVQARNKDTLSPERSQRLEEIGFVWSRELPWDEWYGLLIEYKLREGHCSPTKIYKEGDHALGGWVSAQRTTKDTLSPEQRQKLDDMGFVWDPYAAAWEEGIAALLLFKKRVGDCMVPFGHKEGQHNLAKWVSQVTPR
jgi:hypothetical protein